MKKLFLILALVPIFLMAQYRTPKNYPMFPINVPPIKGKVKTLKVTRTNLKDITLENLNKAGNTANKNSTTIYNFTKNGDIESIININDSLKTISHQKVFIYDTLNNLIQVYSINKNGKKRIEEGYGYDSLGRWVETKHYDSLNNYRVSKFREYKSNDTVIYYNTVGMNSEKCKSVEIYKKNMITTISYFSNNKDIYYKSIETVDGDKKSINSKTYNQKDGSILMSTEESTDSKKSLWQNTWYFSDGSVYSFVQTKNKYNEHHDSIESKRYSSFKKQNSDITIEKLNASFKYDYDNHGNFIKATEYNSNKIISETIRTIEYYD